MSISPKSPSPTLLARIKRVLTYSARTGLLRWHHPEWESSYMRRCRHGEIAGYTHPTSGYIMVSMFDPETRKKRSLRGHCLAWFLKTGSWSSTPIDHANRRKADNRWSNLRASTRNIERWNRPLLSTNTSGVRGVSRTRSGKFVAYIGCDYRRYALGTFGTLVEAAAARAQAELDHYGRRVPSSDGRCAARSLRSECIRAA